MSTVRYVIIALVVIFAAVRIRQRTRGGKRAVPLLERLGVRRIEVRGDIALVAAREVRERTRGRAFRIGTAVILLAVAAAVVIPTLTKGGSSTSTVGVVGRLDKTLHQEITAVGPALGTTITVRSEPSLAGAKRDLDAGKLDVAVIDGARLLIKTAIGASSTSDTAKLARVLAAELSVQARLVQAGIAPDRAARLADPPPLPIAGLHAAPAKSHHTNRSATLYGLIIVFVLLSQYGTWILMGVVEEKSSRVVEVLLAALRPVQLLAGKVLGIGLVALAQAALIVAVALGLGAAVGSDLLTGSAPSAVAVSLLWLLLGYAFYCWVYAAAGSLGTRQEHLQTLAFPVQIPLLVGYITSLTALGSGSASTFVKVLAYLPPTAPFGMPALYALGDAAWWQVTISAVITVVATAGIAWLAATIYLRAILRTGRRVKLREVAFSSP